MSHKGTVIILSHHHPILEERLCALGFRVQIYIQSEIANLQVDYEDVTGIVTSNTCFLPKEKIDLFPNLQFIGRLGSGMEIIDVPYAVSKGIVCFGSPEGNANAVAEHALGMLLTLINHQSKSRNEMQRGLFLRKENMGREIEDLKVGIIGYGHNGSRFADILHYLGAEVYVHDIIEKQIPLRDRFHFSKMINEIISQCNVLSIHIPEGLEQRDKVKLLISRMQQPFIFINVARGSLISTEELYNGLSNGRITGACIDVWEKEPLSILEEKKSNMISKILSMDNVIATPHIAGYTDQAFYKMSKVIADKIEALVGS